MTDNLTVKAIDEGILSRDLPIKTEYMSEVISSELTCLIAIRPYAVENEKQAKRIGEFKELVSYLSVASTECSDEDFKNYFKSKYSDFIIAMQTPPKESKQKEAEKHLEKGE